MMIHIYMDAPMVFTWENHDFPCSSPSPFDVGGTSSHTWVKLYMIEENYCWQKHILLFHYDMHIHGCIDETSLSHLKYSCFLCSLFGSDFGGGSSFTSWMKEHMDDYLDAHYIFWSKIMGHGILTYVIGEYFI